MGFAFEGVEDFDELVGGGEVEGFPVGKAGGAEELAGFVAGEVEVIF